MNDIIIGRDEKDKQKYGDKGTIFIGKHYVKMGRTSSLSNNVFIDVTKSHVIFVCGKRGGGKSYTLGVIAEGVSDLPPEIRQNISIILLDTMGVYWTMKYPNRQDKALLEQWNLEPKGLDIKIFTPVGYYDHYKEKGIPTDVSFSIKPSELKGNDWNTTFAVSDNDPVGVLIERIIYELKEKKDLYSIKDIVKQIDADSESDPVVKNAAKNRFLNADQWGLFSERGTSLAELAVPGQVTVLDLSCYATVSGSWKIKNLVVGLISESLFVQRMTARKEEEFNELHKAMNPFSDEYSTKQEFPLVWLVIDEAHEFLPVTGSTLATDPLITILREGRQPGISLILASQQPGKIHTDVMTQSDTVLAHRITAKLDTDALTAACTQLSRVGTVLEASRECHLAKMKGDKMGLGNGVFLRELKSWASVKRRLKYTCKRNPLPS